MSSHSEKSIYEQLRPIFEPRSVAVIGASTDRSKFGARQFLNALETGYRGTLYPINPNRKEVAGIPAYPSILDVPDNIDMVIIAVAAPLVPQIMEDCVKKGVKGAVLITAGFAEVGEEGKKLQDTVVRIAHHAGIRFIGPNCNGIWSAAVRLNTPFERSPKPGPISFVSQSGTLGGYLFETATSKGYGFSKFVSSGNQASLNMLDYLEYLGQDNGTKAIVLYMESGELGRRFFDIAKEVAKRKPIVIYKGGRTSVGARATLSHTASLAGSDEIFEAACRQAGIIRCYEAFHPFDLAEALTLQPLPKGKRVAIIGSGGQCVCTADACASIGLELPEFDEDTKRRLKNVLAVHAPTPPNPIDTAASPSGTVPKILDIIANLDYIDGIISTGARMAWNQTPDEIRVMLSEIEATVSIMKKYNKPLIITANRSLTQSITFDLYRKEGIPFYTTPEESARAMHGLVRYGEIRRQLEAS